MKYQIVNHHPKVKRPCDVFSSCPRCKAELIQLSPEVLCSKCNWDSIELHIEALMSAHCNEASERSSQDNFVPTKARRRTPIRFRREGTPLMTNKPASTPGLKPILDSPTA